MSASRQCRRVGHSIITAGADLDQLAAHLEGAGWDMVELDVLARGDELIVAHSPDELDHPRPVRFADALRALRDLLPERVELDVDLKSVGYERAVLDTLRSLELVDRTLVSTMEASSLQRPAYGGARAAAGPVGPQGPARLPVQPPDPARRLRDAGLPAPGDAPAGRPRRCAAAWPTRSWPTGEW